MSQVTWGAKPPEFQARPSLLTPFSGRVTQITHAPGAHGAYIRESEKSRRKDGIIPKFGHGGTPGVAPAVTDIWGFLKPSAPQRQIASTMDGDVTLPVHVQDRSYTPTTHELAVATHTVDTRRQPAPYRYYQ